MEDVFRYVLLLWLLLHWDCDITWHHESLWHHVTSWEFVWHHVIWEFVWHHECLCDVTSCECDMRVGVTWVCVTSCNIMCHVTSFDIMSVSCDLVWWPRAHDWVLWPGYISVRLRSIKKEIADKEVAVAEKERRRLETEKQSLYQTRRLGKHTYPYQHTYQEGLCLKELLGFLSAMKFGSPVIQNSYLPRVQYS